MLFAAYVPKGKTQNPNLADIGFAVEKNSVEGSGKDVLKSCELKLGALVRVHPAVVYHPPGRSARHKSADRNPFSHV